MFVDTVLHIQFDRVPLVTQVVITDTAILENKTSIAKSYYSPEQKKIILTLAGKLVDVPVKISKTTTTVSDVKEVIPVKRFPLRYWLLIGFILLFVYAYLMQKKK